MGILRKRGPSIADLKRQASSSMDAALAMFERLVDELKDGVTIDITVAGKTLPFGIRIRVDEDVEEEK